MLHNKHVMVRVGGGWETFESYLLKHDPCRMLQISRVEGKVSPLNSKSPNIKDLTPDSYLVVAAHYRSKKWGRDWEVPDVYVDSFIPKGCGQLSFTRF